MNPFIHMGLAKTNQFKMDRGRNLSQIDTFDLSIYLCQLEMTRLPQLV